MSTSSATDDRRMSSGNQFTPDPAGGETRGGFFRDAKGAGAADDGSTAAPADNDGGNANADNGTNNGNGNGSGGATADSPPPATAADAGTGDGSQPADSGNGTGSQVADAGDGSGSGSQAPAGAAPADGTAGTGAATGANPDANAGSGAGTNADSGAAMGGATANAGGGDGHSADGSASLGSGGVDIGGVASVDTGALPAIGSGDSALGNLGLGNLGLGSVGLGNAGGLLGGLDTGGALNLAGMGGTLQPEFTVANSVLQDVGGAANGVASGIGLGTIGSAATGLLGTVGVGTIGATPAADGHSNLLTDVINLPGDTLDGQLGSSLTHISQDLGDTLGATNALVDAALHAGTAGGGATAGLLGPVTNLLGDLGSSAKDGPIVSLNGGDTDHAGLFGGTIGNLNGSSSGHAIDVDGGPAQTGGLGLGFLTGDSAADHTVSASAIDTGANGPSIAHLGVLTASGSPLGGNIDGLSLPSLGDSLVGHSLGTVNVGDIVGSNGGALNGGLIGDISAGNGSVTTQPGTVTAGDVHDVASLTSDVTSTLDHGLLHTQGTHLL